MYFLKAQATGRLNGIKQEVDRSTESECLVWSEVIS